MGLIDKPTELNVSFCYSLILICYISSCRFFLILHMGTIYLIESKVVVTWIPLEEANILIGNPESFLNLKS